MQIAEKYQKEYIYALERIKEERNILIKDLTEKIGSGKQYIRLAVRCREENQYLVRCLAEYTNQEAQK